MEEEGELIFVKYFVLERKKKVLTWRTKLEFLE